MNVDKPSLCMFTLVSVSTGDIIASNSIDKSNESSSIIVTFK